MKVLMINGSPDLKGAVSLAFKTMKEVFEEQGIEVEIVDVGTKDIRGCIACRTCKKNGKCIFNDLVNEVAPKFKEASGVVLGSPVYYASPNGTLISFLDRLFFSTPFSKRFKVGASVVSCRRNGNSSTFDVLNKYFTINEMPIASSCYWNEIHGANGEEAQKDEEGLYTMKLLALNMSYLMKAIAAQEKNSPLPELEAPRPFTNFIR